MKIPGIDVSSHRGQIDWETVKRSGVRFAMIRAGWGQGVADPCFIRNISECNRLEIPAGVYWFSYALNKVDAHNEAEYCLRAIEPYKIEYPVVWDFEYESVEYALKHGVTIDKELLSLMTEEFLFTIENAGYYAAKYNNRDYQENMYTNYVNKRFALWYAYYANVNTPPEDCVLWQYGKTSIPGVTGMTDVNYSFVDFPSYLREIGANHLENPWYHDAQQYVIREGISDGSNPNSQATRAEVWQMLYNMRGGK